MRQQLALILIVVLTAWPLSARAANPQHIPTAKGAQTLAALTAKRMPMLQGICYYEILNLDSASIWYGLDGGVTDANGIEIPAGLEKFVTLSYSAAVSSSAIWLYSVAGTSAGAVRLAGAC